MVRISPAFSRRIRRGGSRAAARVLDLLFPRSCISCEEPVDEESRFHFVCSPCSRRVTIVRSPACQTCGFPFFGRVESERKCPHCEGIEPFFGKAKTATLMKGPAREMVHRFKYRNQVHLIGDMVRIFEARLGLREFVQGAVLVPVPLHPRRFRERGFNQSQVIAVQLARIFGATGVFELLERVKDTRSQTAFDRRERLGNLKNAFALREKSRLNPQLRYILVDDVFTTGSTCNACAATLRRAGIHRIDVITFGHG